MYVRANLMTADPAAVEEIVEYASSTVRPLVESLPGNRGMLVAVDRETGGGVVATFWEDRAALEASEEQVADARQEARRISRGSVDALVLEMVEQHMRTQPAPGCWQRATMVELEPGDVDKAVESFRASTLPALDSMDGFCAAVLNVDRAGGRAVAVTTWRDRAALEASRDRAENLREEVVDKAHGTVVAIDEREVVLAVFR